ncbi:hypothetical protein [Skermanella pratensis]|uniref:hypothetical protein n=1 Tax=Skermanella pratensis TaxID=2233999 RepID=UPI001FE994E2|nr:hypothetical protein [Skermanella pratensis]
MMANWDLHPLVRDFRRLEPKLVLAVSSGDTAVPPEQAERVRGLLPPAVIDTLGRLGHLAHEERPDLAADLILRHSR